MAIPVFRTSAAGGATTGTTDRTALITPSIGDVLIVFCAVSANTNAAPTCSDDNGGTYTLIGTALFSASVNIMSAFIRNTPIPNITNTTVTVATGSNTSGAIVIAAISNMSTGGISNIRSFGSQANIASGTPSTILNTNAEVNSITLCSVANVTSPAGMTPPSNWTNAQDTGQGSPAIGLSVSYRNSNFNGNTITWGSASASAFASFAVEIDSKLARSITFGFHF